MQSECCQFIKNDNLKNRQKPVTGIYDPPKTGIFLMKKTGKNRKPEFVTFQKPETGNRQKWATGAPLVLSEFTSQCF